jgi:dolichyl-phosphate-mannose--protein O-mannosyl transferase
MIDGNANFSRERKLKSLASDWLIIKNLLFMCEKPFSDTL